MYAFFSEVDMTKFTTAKKLAVLKQGILQLIMPYVLYQPFITAITYIVVTNEVTEVVEALTIGEVFDFAESKGVKERKNVNEYRTLITYDKDTTIKNKMVPLTCEEYKVKKVLDCVNRFDKFPDEKSKKVLAVFLDRIVHGIKRIDYKNGINEMLAYVSGNTKDINIYKKGSEYVLGFIFQEMLYNSANWHMCWSLEQNYNDAVCCFIDFLKRNTINAVFKRDVFDKNIKEYILSLFAGTKEKPISDLETVIYEVRQYVIQEHINKYASEKPILPNQVKSTPIRTQISDIKKGYQEINIDDNSDIWCNLRSPKKILEDVNCLQKKLINLKRAIYQFEAISKTCKDLADNSCYNSISEKQFNIITTKVIFCDEQVSEYLNKMIESNYPSSIHNCLHPELSYTLKRLNDVLLINNYYSGKDIEYNYSKHNGMLNPFDYETFYKNVASLEAEESITNRPDAVKSFLSNLYGIESLNIDDKNYKREYIQISILLELVSKQPINIEDNFISHITSAWDGIFNFINEIGFFPRSEDKEDLGELERYFIYN